MTIKLGSLFDGSGGFPLAGAMCGIEPIWASEIEPYPISVTRSRFPNMKHLGSVTEINGAEVEPVDVITFGSPCQDLSVAGKRAGLKHEDNGDEETTRSGLFMEAIRIIKEMREATNGIHPRIALWENVPGAFSSNKGEDFKVVLEEFIKVVEPTSPVLPSPDKGKWPYAGCIMGEGWSVAWRVLDAQYHGVPQRRRRIFLVADFRDERAQEILFEREGLRGYFAESGTPRETAAADAERSVGADDREGNCLTPWDVQSKQIYTADGVAPPLYAGECRWGGGECYVAVPRLMDAYQHHGWRESDVCGTLTAGQNDGIRGDTPLVCVPYGISSYDSNAMKSPNPHSGIYEAETARTLDLNGGNPACNQGGIAIVEGVPYTLKIRSGVSVDSNGKAAGKGALIQVDKAATLAASQDQYLFQPVVYESHPQDSRIKEAGGVSPTVSVKWHKGAADTPLVCGKYLFENHSQDSRYRGPLEVCPMLPAQLGTGGNNQPFVVEGATVYCIEGNGTRDSHQGNGYSESDTMYTLNTVERHAVAYAEAPPRYIVRRLTPTECARLQGFPDKWGHPDSKTEFADEETAFWQEVRDTYAEANGKPKKRYTAEQLLKWYNKLHTDSSEYKMWGNGVALPCVLYIMEGIAEVLNER